VPRRHHARTVITCPRARVRRARREPRSHGPLQRDECFFTGTPPSSPDPRGRRSAVGAGHRGAVTKELQDAFFAARRARIHAHRLAHLRRRLRPAWITSRRRIPRPPTASRGA
jgi:hypothetical protein